MPRIGSCLDLTVAQLLRVAKSKDFPILVKADDGCYALLVPQGGKVYAYDLDLSRSDAVLTPPFHTQHLLKYKKNKIRLGQLKVGKDTISTDERGAVKGRSRADPTCCLWGEISKV